MLISGFCSSIDMPQRFMVTHGFKPRRVSVHLVACSSMVISYHCAPTTFRACCHPSASVNIRRKDGLRIHHHISGLDFIPATAAHLSALLRGNPFPLNLPLM